MSDVVFAQSSLLNAPIANWTSLEFGPDGRLYASQQNGTIFAFTIEATANGYSVVGTEQINAIKSITNYDDDGNVSATQGTRQVTGILVAPTAPGAPVTLYVSSSDPRIGAGPGGGDTNLDTNSGIISKLTQLPGGGWERIDLVRGLPRSEENHSVNGMQLSADGTKLYVTVGGFTNQGAPSNNFAYTPEYALSAAIIEIDLAAVEALPTKTDAFGNKYKYDLPTLDGNPNDPNQNDPFGGFDGLNQAVIVPDGPVQIYSPGYRNAYDLVLTQAGKLYTIDNGGNAGWGGLPIGEGPAVDGESNVTNAPNDGGPDTNDHLHLVTEGFYAGFPNPIRADPTGAGWYLDGSTTPLPASSLPASWPPVPTADPRQGDFLYPGQDGALYSGWGASTNGITEYTSTAFFGGAMAGDLLTVGFDDQLYRIELTADGTAVTAVTKLTQGTSVLGGGAPLDVTTQGDGEVFAGTIWVANYQGGFTVFTPSNTPPPPPSGDADGDGLSDSTDPFAVDPANGKQTQLAPGQTLTWSFVNNIDPPGPDGIFPYMGFTGVMTNGTDSYLALYDPANIRAGGAAGGFEVQLVSAGDAFQGNTQQNGFQFGLDILSGVPSFTIEAKIDNPFGGDPSTTPVNWKSQGFFIGTGDQDNYLKVVAAANGGAGGVEVAFENAGAFGATMYPASITGPGIQFADSITLKLAVDMAAGTATPSWTYTVGGVQQSGGGTAVQLTGATLQALQGNYTVAGKPSALAVGILSTSFGSGEEFRAFWESIKITAGGTAPPPTPALVVTQSGGSTAVTEGGATDSFTVALATAPTANVTVTVSGTADVNVSSGSGTPGASTTLTFTPTNWNIAKTVTVTAVNDTLVEGPESANVTFAVASTDAGYSGLSVAPVVVAVTDNDGTPTPGDADGDGLSDTVDRFALDATNGGLNNLAQLGTITLDFNTGTTPFGAGFTGVMTNGTQSYTALAASGSVANGKLSVQTTAGDAHSGNNTQQNAYQFGVDTSGVQGFTVQAKVFNPYLNGVAVENWRGAGLQFGAGDQDNYAKLIFHSNDGAGGIEFLVESGGVPSGPVVALGVPVSSIAYGMFYVDVVKTATGATATPRWTLHDANGAQIGSGNGVATALTGALLDAVQGDLVVNGQQSELAVGVVSTHTNSSGPITASWDSVSISASGVQPPPAAGLVVTQSNGSTAVTEGGATDSFTVALASAPTSNVTVTVSGNADVNVSSGSGTPGATTTLTFTPTDWNVAKTVNVAAVNDTLVEGPETANITFATSSTSAAYNNLAVAPVAVSVTDNDTAPTGGAQARLSVTPGAALNASTYTSGAFKLDNLSTGGQQLTSLTIDLGTAIFPGMVFDPTGQAGDATAKGFTVDQANGFTVSSFAFGNGSNAAGYTTLTLQLAGFDPGETLLFSVDVDPNSIQGVAAPGPGESGSVAGLELTGATIGYGFGATTLTNELFKQSSSAGGATSLGAATLPGQPTIAVAGVSGATGTVGAAQQTVSVSGAPNAVVRVLVIEGAQYTAGVPAAAPDLGPFDANSAVKVTSYDVQLNGSGQGQVQVALSASVPEGGLNLITAATLGGTDVTGPAAPPVVLRYAPASTGVTVTQSGGTTAVTEGGATDTLSIVLTSAPTANVTVTVNGNADLAVSSGSGTPGASTTLTFTPTNWNVAKTVTVTAVNDTLVEGPETANLTFATASTDGRYNSLAIAPVPVAITDNDQGTPPPSPVVVGGSTGLTGSLGTQSWGPIDVSAKSLAGAATLVTKTADGLGVQGGRFANQVDYSASSGTSEVLRLDFDGLVDTATLRIARMNPNDAPGSAEVGAWKAFSASGALIGQGLLDPRGKTAVSQWTYDFAINPTADFAALELTALPYNNGTQTGSGDSSDFSLAQITYLPSDQVL